MFSVLFEVCPKPHQWESYLGIARMLRPELVQVDGFIDNIRYRSLTRDGWLLSLSGWRDEKALVRWRTAAIHHDAQVKGRTEVFRDYHLRVGQVTNDSRPPPGQTLRDQRLDETESGAATTVILIDVQRPSDEIKNSTPETLASRLGLDLNVADLVGWDVFEAVLTPGDIIILLSLRNQTAAETFEAGFVPQSGARLRRIRIVRDYGMFSRAEAPQYYPEVQRPTS